MARFDEALCHVEVDGVLRVEGGGVGVCIDVMHGRSRMIIDSRTPTMPGRSTSGFTDQAGIGCTNSATCRGVGQVA